MFRPLIIATLLASGASAAHAQTAGGPPIAYVKVEGSAGSIYLTSDTGAGTVKLYTTPSKKMVTTLDLKPGGGEIAFVERGKGSAPVLKVIRFDENGARLGVPETLSAVCSPDTVDYHPTEPLLIISDICGGPDPRIATIRTDGTGYSVLVSGSPYLNKARWLKDGISYVYARSPVDGGLLQLCRNSCNPDSGEMLRTASMLTWMDVGRTSNTILFTDGQSFIQMVNGDTGEMIASNFIAGTDGHFSPLDDRVLYETPHQARGDFIQIREANGSTTRVTAKGDYGPKDWRN